MKLKNRTAKAVVKRIMQSKTYFIIGKYEYKLMKMQFHRRLKNSNDEWEPFDF